MNENTTKRREWVKNAAIIFLAVMLVLTFFSNTIMNYSLPIVAAQYVNSGSITAKIRGTGTIEAGDPYNVELTQSRVIKSVAVKQGDVVAKDQVLFYLEVEESEDLKAAQKAFTDALLAYEKEILSGTISNQVVSNAQAGKVNTIEGYQAKINAANKAETDAQAVVTSLDNQITEVNRQLGVLGYTNVDVSAETQNLNNAKNSLNSVETALANAQLNLTIIQNKYDTAAEIISNYENGITISGGDAVKNEEIEKKYKQAKLDLSDYADQLIGAKSIVNEWEAKLAQCKVAVDTAQEALDAKNASLKSNSDVTVNNLNTQLANLNAQKAAAEVNLDKAKEEKAKLLADIQAELSLGSQNVTLQELKDEVTKLREESVGAEIKAPVAGTITTLNYVAGETIKPDMPLAVIQPEGKGFSLSFSVTADQAKKLTPGDPAEVQNSWYYSDITATLVQIKNDPENPGKNKLLVFDVAGDVMDGQSLSLSVGQKSANYDMIVPNSAIREDNNGKFVLIVESKSSPLGNRYIATRVDVEVLASDDTQSAISGALYGYEFVITTSNKPVEAGKQVRLSDN